MKIQLAESILAWAHWEWPVSSQGWTPACWFFQDDPIRMLLSRYAATTRQAENAWFGLLETRNSILRALFMWSLTRSRLLVTRLELVIKHSRKIATDWSNTILVESMPTLSDLYLQDVSGGAVYVPEYPISCKELYHDSRLRFNKNKWKNDYPVTVRTRFSRTLLSADPCHWCIKSSVRRFLNRLNAIMIEGEVLQNTAVTLLKHLWGFERFMCIVPTLDTNKNESLHGWEAKHWSSGQIFFCENKFLHVHS